MNSLLSLLIFSLPFGVLFRVALAPNVFIYPHDIIAGLILILYITRITTSGKIKEKKLLILICLFLMNGFASLVLNVRYLTPESFIASFAYLLRYASYAGLLFVIPQFELENSIIKVRLIISGLLFVLLGFAQSYLFPSLIRIYHLGWDEHRGRLFSTFFDPNFAGFYIVLIGLLLAGFLLEHKKNDRVKILILAALFATAIAMFLTHSRSAWIAALFGGGVFLQLNKMYKQIIILVVVLVIGLAAFANTRVEALNPWRIASSEARIHSALDAISIFTQNPIVGVGFNSYRYAQERYGTLGISKIPIRNADAGTDNSYLFVLATTGVIGFLFFADFWINVIRRIYRETKFSSVFAKVTVASIVALLVNTLFINSMFYTPIATWVFLLIGLTLNKKR